MVMEKFKLKKYIHKKALADVVQWIEHWYVN